MNKFKFGACDDTVINIKFNDESILAIVGGDMTYLLHKYTIYFIKNVDTDNIDRRLKITGVDEV